MNGKGQPHRKNTSPEEMAQGAASHSTNGSRRGDGLPGHRCGRRGHLSGGVAICGAAFHPRLANVRASRICASPWILHCPPPPSPNSPVERGAERPRVQSRQRRHDRDRDEPRGAAVQRRRRQADLAGGPDRRWTRRRVSRSRSRADRAAARRCAARSAVRLHGAHRLGRGRRLHGADPSTPTRQMR